MVTEEPVVPRKDSAFAEPLVEIKPAPTKFYEEDEWQPHKSSEAMEDVQRPPRLPESLECLRDWRTYTGAEARLMGNRMSMGSSMGEQRLSLADSFNAWPSIDTGSNCEKLQLGSYDLPTARPSGPVELPSQDESKKALGICLFDKGIREPEDRSTEMSSKGDSARSPNVLNRKEDIVVSEEEGEEKSEAKEPMVVAGNVTGAAVEPAGDKSGNEENDPNVGNVKAGASGSEKPARSSNKKRCCNCKKSRCLKLYCECFASQDYCVGCKCVDCHNTAEYAEEKKAAVSRVNTKNPLGFLRRLPVSVQEPVVGCNCKRSGCQRNYCCCYKKGGQCSSLCKCTQCKNGKEPCGTDTKLADASISVGSNPHSE